MTIAPAPPRNGRVVEPSGSREDESTPLRLLGWLARKIRRVPSDEPRRLEIVGEGSPELRSRLEAGLNQSLEENPDAVVALLAEAAERGLVEFGLDLDALTQHAEDETVAGFRIEANRLEEAGYEPPPVGQAVAALNAEINRRIREKVSNGVRLALGMTPRPIVARDVLAPIARHRQRPAMRPRCQQTLNRPRSRRVRRATQKARSPGGDDPDPHPHAGLAPAARGSGSSGGGPV